MGSLVGTHLSIGVGTNVDYTDDEINTFSKEDVEQVELGSKLYLLNFYA